MKTDKDERHVRTDFLWLCILRDNTARRSKEGFVTSEPTRSRHSPVSIVDYRRKKQYTLFQSMEAHHLRELNRQL
jgi:hypothetical protein